MEDDEFGFREMNDEELVNETRAFREWFATYNDSSEDYLALLDEIIRRMSP